MELVVALIAVVGAFVGAYFGARWQARSTLEQWQRDQLLQFCADFLAASGTIVDVARDIELGNQPPYPVEATARFEHAYGCICLLNDRLAGSANNHLIATVGLMKVLPANMGPAMEQAAKTRGRFLRAAHNLILGFQPDPSLGSLVWAWVQRGRAWTRTRAAIVKAVTARPAVSLSAPAAPTSPRSAPTPPAAPPPAT